MWRFDRTDTMVASPLQSLIDALQAVVFARLEDKGVGGVMRRRLRAPHDESKP